MTAAYTKLVILLKDIATLKSISGGLSWDEQTYMPPQGSAHRSEQLAYLAGLAHEKSTSAELATVLAEARSEVEKLADEADETGHWLVNVKEAQRAFDRSTKLPAALVQEMARATSLGQQAWITARKEKDFAHFLPSLEKIISLKREEAQAVGSPTGHLYDALLDEYEPGATAGEIAAAFAPLRDELVSLCAQIAQSPVRPRVELLEHHYPKTAQRVFAEAAARLIGFDFERGRIDESAHPFCSGFGPGDCRLTTRYLDHYFPSAFFGVLHEAGHGIYEQGLPEKAFGLASGEAASLGAHESQSRLWENLVGRSKAFWQFFYGSAQQAFPPVLGSVTLDDFYAAVNNVRFSFIRVEADEVTYNLHVMLRFELEQDLLLGHLQPRDLPGAWNERFQKYFGMTPPDDSQGCLQDVHWSAGLLGYFPTYTLGNMYSAQIFEAASGELGDLQAQFAAGQFRPLKEWLNEKIHRQGRRLPATKLMEQVTGHPLSHHSLMSYLRQKYTPLYQLQ